MKGLQRFFSLALSALLVWGSCGYARGAQTAPPPSESTQEVPPVGTLSADWALDVDPCLQQSDLANLVHEAQLWATGAQVSILSAADLDMKKARALFQAGEPLTAADCASLYTGGDTLYMVELSALQLKDWIDRFSLRYSCEGGVASAESGEGIDQIYGISYEVFLGNPANMQVGNLTYQGNALNINQTFQVAVSGSRLKTTSQEDPWGWYETTHLNAESPKVLWSAAESEEFSAEGGTVSAILAKYMETLANENGEIAPQPARSRWKLYPATSEVALRPVTRLQFVEALYEAAGSPAGTKMVRPSECFTDIPYEPIDSLRLSPLGWAILEGIVQGNGSGKFSPDDPITREQALVMLLRYDMSRHAGPEGAWAVALPYTDAAAGSGWAAEALMWNVLKNYLPADDGGNLNPQSPLTATQLEEALSRLAETEDGGK